MPPSTATHTTPPCGLPNLDKIILKMLALQVDLENKTPKHKEKSMASKSILERVPVCLESLEITTDVVEKTEESELKQLAQKASLKLGYCLLEETVGDSVAVQIQREFEEKTRIGKENNELINALLKLDIVPFSKDSVELYKTQAVKDARKVLVKLNPIKETMPMVLVLILMLSLGSIIVLGILNILGFISNSPVLIALATFVGSTVGFVFSINSLKTFEWTNTEIKHYQQPIPEFVLNKALQIKEKVPNAQFFIEHLEEKYDPFLKVKHGNLDLYIEVWDEPKFEFQFLE